MTLTTTTTAGMAELNIGSTLTGKTILLTGVTGFLGKVILEKLLYDGPPGLRILLLLRGSSANLSPRGRFETEVLTSSVFARLRDRGDLEARLESIECVGGEMTMPMLGLKRTEFEHLGQRLDLVVNSAASVDFREALDKALKINTLSLNSLVDLANVGGRCKFVQVSTCYVHGMRSGLISERNNPPVRDAATEAHGGGLHRTAALVRHLKTEAAKLRSSIADPEAAEYIRWGAATEIPSGSGKWSAISALKRRATTPHILRFSKEGRRSRSSYCHVQCSAHF